MKKFNKILSIILVLTIMLSGTVSAKDQNEQAQVIRLEGRTRIQTAIKVSEKAYKDGGAKTVVLVGYAGEVDALTGTILAHSLKAPILFTTKNKLNVEVEAELNRLGAENIIMLGGSDVLSAEVESQLSAYNIKRLNGSDRTYTAGLIAKEVKGSSSDHVFLARGYEDLADALSIGPASAKENDPVLLTKENSLPAGTVKALKDLGVKQVTIIGGSKAVSDKVVSLLSAKGISVKERLAGSRRESTATAIAKKFFNNKDLVIIANGWTYADALVGGYFGAKIDAPILLTNPKDLSSETQSYLEKFANMAYVLGGRAVISEETFNKIIEALKDSTPEPPKEADLTEYNAALNAVKESDYTQASWAEYQIVVNNNKVTKSNTQAQVDAATAAIVAAQKKLVEVEDTNQDQPAPEGLKAIAPSTYDGNDGKITGVTPEMEYRILSDQTWTQVTGSEITGLIAGYYDVRYKAKDGFNPGSPAPINVPAGGIQDQAPPQGLQGIAPSTFGGNDGKITGTTTDMEYRSTSVETWTPVIGGEITGLEAGWYDVRYKARPGYKEGMAATIGVEPGPNQDQAPPQGLQGIAPSTFGGNDGKITGTTVDMEYRSTSVETWAPVTGGEITGLESGWYDVRYKARPGFNEGTAETISVPVPENQDQTAPEGLEGVAPSIYGGNDGKITGTTVEMEYRSTSIESWTPVTGAEITGLEAGWYDVRYKAKDGLNPGSPATINVPEGPNQDQAAPQGLQSLPPSSFGGNDGKITGTTTDMEYRLTSVNTWTDVTGTEISDLKAGWYDVRYKARPGYNEGTAATIGVEPGPNQDQSPPQDLQEVSPSTFGGSDGKIRGTTNKMEYRHLSEDTWTPVTGAEITGLAAGHYDVRYAAKEGFNASDAVTMKIKEAEATLKAIAINEVAMAGFSPDILIYDIVLPAGTTVVPRVVASTTDSNAPVVVTPASSLPGQTILLVTAEDGITTKEYKINFILTNPVPLGLKGVAPTTSGGSDGKITGATSDMEYKLEAGQSWIKVTGTEITGLASGSYYVRYAAKPGFNVGSPANVIVPHLDSGKLIFTFDDGWKDTITVGKPILDSAGFKATVYVNKDLTQAAEYGWSQYHMENVMDYNDLHVLYNHGWDVSNHSTNHLDYKRNSEGLLVGADGQPLEWQNPEEYGEDHPELDEDQWYDAWLDTLVAIGSDPNSIDALRAVYLDNQEWLSSSGPDGLGKEINGVWTPGQSLNMPLSAYHVAYPSGLYSPELIAMLKDIGVKTGRATTETGIKNNIMNPVTDFFNLPVQYVETELVNGLDENLVDVKESIQYAVEHGTTVILMVHRVGPVGDLFVTPESFQEIVDYAKNFTEAGTLDVMTISQWYNIMK